MPAAPPSINEPDQIKTTKKKSPKDKYRPGRQKFVERSYDKDSKLYQPDLWNWHNLYDQQVCYEGFPVTRSQTAYNRIGTDESNTKLFGEGTHHHPPNLPHLMVTMKDGMYGALPRTIVTRSLNGHLETNETLSKTLEVYKTFQTLEDQIKPKRKPSVLQRLFSRADTGADAKKKEEEKKPVVRESSFSQEPKKDTGLLRAPSFSTNKESKF